jgi:hypothetical protein
MEDVQARASLQIIQAGIDDKGWRMREEKNDSWKVEERVSKSMEFMIPIEVLKNGESDGMFPSDLSSSDLSVQNG